MIPFNQTIIVIKSTGTDDWGKPIYDELNPIEIECRVDEGSHVTADVRSMQSGKIIVPEARILIEGLADLKYADKISYTNELGHTITKLPERITVRRDIGASPLMTEVLI